MSSGLEQELKLVAPDAEVLDAVLESNLVRRYLIPGGDPQAKPVRFRGIYYDTLAGDLGRERCSLRARQEGDRLVAALKMAGEICDGLSSRIEYETPIERLFSHPRELPESDLKHALLQRIDGDALLIARVEVDMRRRIRDLLIPDTSGEGSEVELVADDGVISGGGRSESLREIELELKSGSLAPLLALGEELRAAFDLTPSVRTKHGIGIALIAEAHAAG